MKKAGGRRWGGWAPHLFDDFDPYRSFLTRSEVRFRDADGNPLLEVDESIELLLLGFSALTEIGGGRLPSAAAWKTFLAETEERIIRGSETWDVKAYSRRFDGRLKPLNWFTYSQGSLEISFLHDELLRATEDEESASLRRGWCALCLLWVDRAVFYFMDRDVALAIEASLRAADALACARPRKTPQEVRRELSSKAGKARAAKDRTAPWKAGAYQFWCANRKEIPVKAEIARRIQDRFPDLLNVNVILRWIREWEKQSAA